MIYKNSAMCGRPIANFRCEMKWKYQTKLVKICFIMTEFKINQTNDLDTSDIFILSSTRIRLFPYIQLHKLWACKYNDFQAIFRPFKIEYDGKWKIANNCYRCKKRIFYIMYWQKPTGLCLKSVACINTKFHILNCQKKNKNN